MRIAVLSDIHANRLALEAVLEDCESQDIERYWFLGDAIGYGPEPVAPVLWVKYYVKPGDWVLGNHDLMARDLKSTSTDTAPEAIMTAKRHLVELQKNEEAYSFWLDGFGHDAGNPAEHTIDGVDYVLVHGDQFAMRYVYAWSDLFLQRIFERLYVQSSKQKRPRIQLFGHTHIPTLIKSHSIKGHPLAEEPIDTLAFQYEVVKILPGETYDLDGGISLLNPGSVGQPRDLDHRAAYAIVNTEEHTVTFRRVEYAWQAVCDALRDASYPDSLRIRLIRAAPPKETPNEWLTHYERSSEEIRS